MVENQHRDIKDCRELTQDERDMLDKIKEKEAEINSLVNELIIIHGQTGGHAINTKWVTIGETDLRKGLMALTRSIFD